jgi:hypothetical protein
VTRRLTVLFSAFEALLTLGIGIAVPLVPLTALWALYFGFTPDWVVFGRAAVDVWLLGHGVDVTFALDPATASALGVAGADAPVPITLALLGGALLTVLLARRAGERIAETGQLLLGGVTAIVVVAALSLGLALLVAHPAARPSLVQAALLPALVFAVGLVLGARRVDRTLPGTPAVAMRDAIADRLDDAPRLVLGDALRAGTAVVALVLAASAVALAAALVVHYAEIIGLYESLHTEVLGGITVTLGELGLLPNLVVWTASWLTGPGFAIGAGSQVSPLGTALGPVPAVPVLGAVPTSDTAFGFVGLLVPIVAAFAIGVVLRRGHTARRREAGLPAASLGVWVALAAGTGVVGGALLGLLAAAASGSAGPGRLAQVGPDPLAVALWATVEFATACGIGLAAARGRALGGIGGAHGGAHGSAGAARRPARLPSVGRGAADRL